MKYATKINLIVIIMFFISLLVGLVIISQYIAWSKNPLDLYLPLPIVFLSAVMLVYIKIKDGIIDIVRTLYFLLVLLGLSVILALFIDKYLALLLAIVLYLLKIYWKNLYTGNIIEMLVAGGGVSLMVASMEALNLFNVFVASLVLIAVSILDAAGMYNIKAGKDLKAGLIVWPKKEENKGDMKTTIPSESYSFVGLGDIMFTLFFADAVFREILIKEQFLTAFIKSLIVPAIATAALLFLMFKVAKAKRYYPAMPFISIGCFAGYGVVWLIGMV